GQAPARQAALFAGLPDKVAAVTINKVCASGLKAVTLAADSIRTGDQDLIVAGGMENMSAAPYLLPKARWGYRHGNAELVDAMVRDGLWDVYNDFHMGITGEVVAEKYGITREEQDAFAYESHMRALKAIKEGRFEAETIAVPLEGPEGEVLFEVDEGVRPDTSLEKLARLPAVFQEGGTVTAGNASQLSDGGAAVVVSSQERADEMGATPLGRILGYTTGGVSPKFVMEAPIPTVNRLLRRLDLTIHDFDLFEHNEAYASASLAVARQLEIPMDKLNVNGGAVALGHPLGCTGARILTTLLYAMKGRDARRGLATLCLGGGNAVAVAVEAA
ncbi:MAG: thiolase family protein, partial [Thermoplasmata archaeon]